MLNKNENKLVYIFFIVALAMFFFFGFFRLTKFVTTDEHYWVQERIPQYWKAVSEGNWKKTLINDKPGVSLAFVSGIGLFFENNPELYIKSEKHISVYNPFDTERLNFIFRLPLLLFNGLALLYLFWVIKKITNNRWLALWSSILILCSPIILGISRIINPDSLLWIFSVASIFSFIAFLKSKEKKFIAYTSVFLGFALLSKYIAFILFPFLFIMLILHLLENLKEWKKDNILTKKIIRISACYWLVAISAIFVFVIFFPAVLSKSYFQEKTVGTILSELKIIFPAILFFNIIALGVSHFLNKIKNPSVLEKLLSFDSRNLLGKLVYGLLLFIFIIILINWTLGNDFLNLSSVPFDSRKDLIFSQNASLYQKVILEFYPVVFSLSPYVLGLVIFLWSKSLFRKSNYDSIIFPISLFLLIYAGAEIFNNLLATIRYNIILYPLILFLSAIGILELQESVPFLKTRKIGISVAFVILGFLTLWNAKPFYFEYTNLLLPKKYLITGSWGEGGYEAAQYLNSLPNAKDLTIWADYSGTCEFFVGKCLKLYKVEDLKNSIDYYVLTRRGEIRYQPDHTRWVKNPDNVDAYKYYKKENPEWFMNINDRPGDFIKIFKSVN